MNTIQQENDYTDALFAYQDQQRLERARIDAACAKAKAYRDEAYKFTYALLGIVIFASGALAAVALVLCFAASGLFFVAAFFLAGISASLNEKRKEIDFLRHVKALDRLRDETPRWEFSCAVERLSGRVDGWGGRWPHSPIWEDADRQQ